MTFEVGDKVIPRIMVRIVADRGENHPRMTCGFYHLHVANDTTVLRPSRTSTGGLRRASAMRRRTAFGLLGDGKIDNHQNWKGRSRTTRTRCAAGRSTTWRTCSRATFLAKSKSLSFREKRMLDPREIPHHLGSVGSDARNGCRHRRARRSCARTLLHHEARRDAAP